jgi:hypothetical protein
MLVSMYIVRYSPTKVKWSLSSCSYKLSDPYLPRGGTEGEVVSPAYWQLWVDILEELLNYDLAV